MKCRTPKKEDQEKADKAFLLLKQSAMENDDIDMNQWIGACFSLIVDRFIDAGLDFNQFSQELDEIRKHYKPWFDE